MLKTSLQSLKMLVLTSITVLLSCVSTSTPFSSVPKDSDPWLLIIDEARWAQNAHNIQPWRLVLNSDKSTLLAFVEPERLLSQTDPEFRQMAISFGTLMAGIEVAAKRLKLGVEFEIEPEGSWSWSAPFLKPLFSARLVKPLSASNEDFGLPKIDAVSAATVKYKVTALDLPTKMYREQETRFSTSTIKFQWVGEEGGLRAWKEIAQGSYALEMHNPPTLSENMQYTIIGQSVRKNKPYGITMLGNFNTSELGFAEAFSQTFPLSPKQYQDISIKMFNKAVEASRAFLIVTSTDSGAPTLLELGRRLQYLWWEIHGQGGRFLTLSQALQEYPAMSYWYKKAQALGEGRVVQMILSLGKPDGDFLNAPRFDPQSLFGVRP